MITPFWPNICTDVSIILAIFILSVGFSALTNWRYSFLHFFLIIESLSLALNLFFVSMSVIFNSIDGEVFVLFNIAVAAAETAIGLSLYLALITEKPRRMY